MNIKKVVIIGSGTMGSGIAAHLCNANIPVVLLDLKTEIAEKAKEKILKSRPPLLFENSKIQSLKIGNISDNFDNVAGISFLPHSDHTYKQAPYQECSKKEYLDLLKKMPKKLDWQDLIDYEVEDSTRGGQELACSADSC